MAYGTPSSVSEIEAVLHPHPPRASARAASARRPDRPLRRSAASRRWPPVPRPSGRRSPRRSRSAGPAASSWDSAEQAPRSSRTAWPHSSTPEQRRSSGSCSPALLGLFSVGQYHARGAAAAAERRALRRRRPLVRPSRVRRPSGRSASGDAGGRRCRSGPRSCSRRTRSPSGCWSAIRTPTNCSRRPGRSRTAPPVWAAGRVGGVAWQSAGTHPRAVAWTRHPPGDRQSARAPVGPTASWSCRAGFTSDHLEVLYNVDIDHASGRVPG